MDLLRIFEQQPGQDNIGHLLGGQSSPQPKDDQGTPTGIGNLLGGSEQGQTEEKPANQNDESDQDQQLDSMVDQAATQDPDKQGLIRTVKDAHLIYKRENNGMYEELWIYNIGKLQDELKIRKAILAGTDIPTNKMASPDGRQTYDIWSAGNAELLHITGLPN